MLKMLMCRTFMPGQPTGLRGFRRVSPTAPPQQSKEVPPRNPPTRSSSPGSTSRATPASGAPQTGTGKTAGTTPTVNERLQTLAMDNRSSHMETAGRTQYCHYFTNFGNAIMRKILVIDASLITKWPLCAKEEQHALVLSACTHIRTQQGKIMLF